MSDLSQLSDEQLIAAYNAKKSQADLSSLSDQQLIDAYNSKKSMLQRAVDLGSDVLHGAGQVVEHLGPGQVKNFSAILLGQKENNLKNNLDMITGGNAPGFGEILNNAQFPSARIVDNADGYADNLADFKTTPSLPQEEQDKLKTFDTGYNTNDVLGAILELKAGDKAVGNAKAVLAPLKNAGPATSQAFEKAANFIRPAEQKVNAAEIAAAGKRLGITVTPGMLDNSGFVERLENELSKSPSFLGQSVAKRQQAVTDALENTVKSLTQDASDLTPKQLGEKVQKGMSEGVQSQLEPISKTFDDVRNSTQNVPIGERPVAAIVRNIENIPSYRLTEGAGKPSRYVEMIKRAQNADDIKTIMSMLNGDLSSPSIDSAEKYVLGEIKGKLARLESNSITRAAIQQSKDTATSMKTGLSNLIPKISEGEAKDAAKEVINNLAQARTDYKELSGNLSNISKDARVAKNVSPGQFISKVEDLQPEQVPQKFFNENNQRLLDNLKKQFPKEFELLRQGKLAEIKASATDATLNGQGRLSAQRFLNEIKGINPEGQQSIFGKNAVSQIKDLKTVQQSIPRNFNPSGTASSHKWNDALWQNVKDIPTYMLYRGASSNLANNIRTNLLKIPSVLELSKSNPDAFEGFVNKLGSSGVVTNAADQKSPEKWMNNGIKKLEQTGEIHTSLNELKNDPQIAPLLIRAADAKSDDQLKKIVEQIRDTEAFKKAPKSGPKTSNKYPMTLRKNGHKATISSDQDYYEARSEGWA